MIIIDTRNGLANRIRSAVSGMILAEELGEEVVVQWAPKAEVCAAAHDQIYADSDSKIFAEKIDAVPGEEIWTVKSKWGKPTLFGMRPDYDDLRWPADLPADVLAARSGTVRIRTSWNFKAATTSREHYNERYSELLQQHFRPLDVGDERSDPPTHGIHIRRGDKTLNMRQRLLGNASNPARCEREMRRILREDEQASFLLCSDDTALKQRLCRSLGERVRTLDDGSMSRNSVAGIRFAARELYALSLTGTILGDGDSTFGPTASQYRNIPYLNLAPSVAPRARQLLYGAYKRSQKIRKQWARTPTAGV